MFGGGNATNEPLMGGQQDQDDSASQGSSQRSLGGRSSSSLLERIQQQRQRELAAAATNAGAASISSSSNMSVPPQQIQVPQYGQTVMPGFGNSDVVGQQQSYFAPSNGWNLVSPQNFQANGTMPISNDMASAEKSQMFHDTQTEMHHALLPPSSAHGFPHGDQNYSLSEYFLTFVKDIYGLFLRLHVVLRVVVVIGLLYLAVKLLFYV
jgi:hypothetical protein